MITRKLEPLITQSDLFKIGFYNRSGQHHPDVVEFFDLFGLKTFVGSLNIEKDIAPSMDLGIMFSQFNHFLDNYDETRPWDAKSVNMAVHNAYFTKLIYNDFKLGNVWHTPITAVYNHDNNNFALTKGAKKILASELIGIKTLPAVILSRDKKLDGKKLKLIKSDRELYNFIDSLSPGNMKDPSIGIEYFDIEGLGKVPGIHWINVSEEASQRSSYHTNFMKDLKTWRRYPGRIVTSDVLPKNLSRYHDQKLLSGLRPDPDAIRKHMPKNAWAHVHSDKDRDICSKLVNALAWLSTTADINSVGEAVSSCGRYRVIYNNKSDVRIEIPHGILNK